MIKLAFIFLAFPTLLLTSIAAAFANPLTVVDFSCVCSPAMRDRLENPAKFNFGAFSGKCIDSCRYRRSHLLEPAKNAGVGSVEISNFMHKEMFWRASIPIDKAEGAEIGFEEFFPGVYHVFLLFHFTHGSPVKLYDQTKKQSPEVIEDLVVSPEGIPPKASAYRLMDAYLGKYVIGYRILSSNEMKLSSVHKLKHPVHLYRLQLNAFQVKILLKEALALGEERSFRSQYQLFSNNCATNALDLIDSVTEPDRKEYPLYYRLLYPIERALPIASPWGTKHVFTSRKLIEEKGRSWL